MNVGQRVTIRNTNSIWDGKSGVVESISGDDVLVNVDFDLDKGRKVKQTFYEENLDGDDVDNSLEESLNECKKDIENNELKESSNMKRLNEAEEKLIKEVEWEGHKIKFFNTFHSTGTKSHDVLKMEMDGTNTYTGETTWINRPWHRFDLEEAFDEIVSKAFGKKALALVQEIDKNASSVEDAIDKFFAQFKSEDIQADDEVQIDDSTEGRKNALAKYLEVDPSELEEIDDNTFAYDDGEYKVLTDSEADDAFDEDVRNLWDEGGLEYVGGWLKDWILENALNDDEFESFVREDKEGYVYDMGEEDLIDECISDEIVNEEDVRDEDGEIREDVDFDDLREKLINFMVEDTMENETFGEYLKDMGMDEEYIKQYIDEEKVIEAIKDDIDTNGSGRGQNLAYYDGEEIELDGGLYAYRVN